MRALQFLLAVLVLAGLACGSGSVSTMPIPETPTPRETAVVTKAATEESTVQSPAPVPGEYRELYNSLEGILERFHGSYEMSLERSGEEVIIGAELATSNGNRGEALLKPEGMYGVRLYLDRLQELGVGGVKVAISYPLLDDDFPRSEEYLEYYKGVAEEVRNRGMKLLVQTGPVFPDPEFSNVQVDFSNLTMTAYFQGRKEQVLIIIDEVRPDYVCLGAEPETEAMLTGFPITPEVYVNYIEDTLSEIDRLGDTLVGAGSGIWEKPEYLNRFAHDTTLDFINIHIYPIQGAVNYLQRVVDTAPMIRAQGKKLIIGESWLYKASPGEVVRGKAYQEIFLEDVYSFWVPLDIRFIEAVMKIGYQEGFEFVSFFWSKYFFAYLDYEDTPKDLHATELVYRSNQASANNIQSGLLSETGEALQQLIDSGFDQ
ncbi:MAG: hypothetical protein GTO18_08145 [Anaerolineales bacterium]|nr:hypothetical protein [Anaerolineales bacterium]